jgi:hypothetical protein
MKGGKIFLKLTRSPVFIERRDGSQFNACYISPLIYMLMKRPEPTSGLIPKSLFAQR